MWKKVTLITASLLANGLALAAPPAPSSDSTVVTIPCMKEEWTLGVKALYLQSSYGAKKAYELDPNGNFKEVKNKWGWGYELDGAAYLNAGNDISLAWLHYRLSTQRNAYTGFTPYSGAALIPFNLVARTQFDRVNLVSGQQVSAGIFNDFRFYGGIQYASIQVNSINGYAVVPQALLRIASGLGQYRNVNFNGFGPVVGVDYGYSLAKGFGLIANASTAILYGTNRYNSGFVFSPSNLVQTSIYASKKGIVPGFEAKLGANYAYEYREGKLNLGVGYQAMNYFDVLETRGSIGLNTATSTNFGLYGPYLSAQWIGYA